MGVFTKPLESSTGLTAKLSGMYHSTGMVGTIALLSGTQALAEIGIRQYLKNAPDQMAKIRTNANNLATKAIKSGEYTESDRETLITKFEKSIISSMAQSSAFISIFMLPSGKPQAGDMMRGFAAAALSEGDDGLQRATKYTLLGQKLAYDAATTARTTEDIGNSIREIEANKEQPNKVLNEIGKFILQGTSGESFQGIALDRLRIELKTKTDDLAAASQASDADARSDAIGRNDTPVGHGDIKTTIADHLMNFASSNNITVDRAAIQKIASDIADTILSQGSETEKLGKLDALVNKLVVEVKLPRTVNDYFKTSELLKIQKSVPFAEFKLRATTGSIDRINREIAALVNGKNVLMDRIKALNKIIAEKEKLPTNDTVAKELSEAKSELDLKSKELTSQQNKLADKNEELDQRKKALGETKEKAEVKVIESIKEDAKLLLNHLGSIAQLDNSHSKDIHPIIKELTEVILKGGDVSKLMTDLGNAINASRSKPGENIGQNNEGKVDLKTIEKSIKAIEFILNYGVVKKTELDGFKGTILHPDHPGTIWDGIEGSPEYVRLSPKSTEDMASIIKRSNVSDPSQIVEITKILQKADAARTLKNKIQEFKDAQEALKKSINHGLEITSLHQQLSNSSDSKDKEIAEAQLRLTTTHREAFEELQDASEKYSEDLNPSQEKTDARTRAANKLAQSVEDEFNKNPDDPVSRKLQEITAKTFVQSGGDLAGLTKVSDRFRSLVEVAMEEKGTMLDDNMAIAYRLKKLVKLDRITDKDKRERIGKIIDNFVMKSQKSAVPADVLVRWAQNYLSPLSETPLDHDAINRAITDGEAYDIEQLRNRKEALTDSKEMQGLADLLIALKERRMAQKGQHEGALSEEKINELRVKAKKGLIEVTKNKSLSQDIRDRAKDASVKIGVDKYEEEVREIYSKSPKKAEIVTDETTKLRTKVTADIQAEAMAKLAPEDLNKRVDTRMSSADIQDQLKKNVDKRIADAQRQVNNEVYTRYQIMADATKKTHLAKIYQMRANIFKEHIALDTALQDGIKNINEEGPRKGSKKNLPG